MSKEATIAKLERFLGPAQAAATAAECMVRAGIDSLDTPDDRLRFARELERGGGALAAVGNAIAVQSILEGAKGRKESGTYERPIVSRKA